MTKRIMRAFKLFEISGVDNPAQVHATLSIIKRQPSAEDIAKSVEAIDFNEATAELGAMYQADEIYGEIGERWSALQLSFQSIACDETLDGAAKIAAMKASLLQFAADIDAYASDPGADEEQVTKTAAALAKRLSEDPATAGIWNAVRKESATRQPGDQDMKTIQELTAEVATLTGQMTALTTEKNALTAKVAEADAAKVAAETKVTELTKAAEIAKTDESYTSDGITIRKSVVGEDMFKAFKAQGERLELADLTKRAETDIGLLPCDGAIDKAVTDKGEIAKASTTMKAKVLKAVNAIAEEPVRNAVMQMLKAGNGAMKLTMKAVGRDGSSEDGSDALTTLDTLAKARATEKKIDYTKAYAEITAEHPELYDQEKAERRARARA